MPGRDRDRPITNSVVGAVKEDHGAGNQEIPYNTNLFGFPDQLSTVDDLKAEQLCH